MRAHCHAYGRKGRLSDHTCQLLWCYTRAVICREPESCGAASRPRQYRPVFAYVAVNDTSEQLINRALVGSFLLGLSGRKNDTPLTPNLHKAAADLQPGEVLPPDRAKGKQRQHQSIADLTGSGKLRQFLRSVRPRL